MVTRESFAYIFEYYLSQKRLSLSDFAKRMTDYGLKTTYQQAYRWKKGKSLPNALQLIAICNVLQIHDVPRILSQEQYKKLLKAQAKKDEKIIQMPAVEDKEDRISHRQLPIILQKASAGYGQFIEDADMEMVYVRESVPESASFGIHVSGDSMEPKFKNGDLVWVEQKDTLNSGEVGVFYLDGNIYIKRLEYGQGEPCLKSLNRKYKNIPIRETSVFTVWGKVLD